MDTAYLSALAALTGTAVGGLTSFFSTWLAQNAQFKAQFKAQLFLHDKGHRQELYRDFVDEASQLYIDALTNDQPNLSKTITLYALVSQMRFISSPKVIEEAEKVVRVILETYPNPTRHLVSCAIWRTIWRTNSRSTHCGGFPNPAEKSCKGWQPCDGRSRCSSREYYRPPRARLR